MQKILNIFGILLSMLLFFSCHKDNIESRSGGGTVSSDSKSVYFSMRMPANASNTTTPGTDLENKVESIYILAFRVDGSDPEKKEYYDYKAAGYSIQDGNNIKNFKANVLKKDHDQNFVIITNAGTKANSINELHKDLPKEQVMELLTHENSDIWHSGDPSNFPCLPMWGESGHVKIDDSSVSIETIKVVRMVSRIDVVLDTDFEDDFELESLHLYNYHTNGRIAPILDDQIWNSGANKAISVSLPAQYYDKTDGCISTNSIQGSTGKYLPSVYTFESTAPAASESLKATCLVVGGTYSKDSKPTYYRLDFFATDDTGNQTGFRELLRNHLYRVNITSVSGSGYTDPDDAFRSKSENMTAEIKEWDHGDISDVVFDKNYYLGVSPKEIHVSKEASDSHTFVIETDYPSGWSYTIDREQYGWLDFVASGPLGNTQNEDIFTFSVEDNDTGSERTGYIKITAGRMTIVVKVVQSPREDISINIKDEKDKATDQLLFVYYPGKNTVPPQEYNVIWSPVSETVFVSYYDGAQAFPTGSYDNPKGDNTLFNSTGTKTYRIKPTDFTVAEVDENTGNPFLGRETRFNYIIGEGSTIQARNINLKQQHYDLIAYPEETYALDGTDGRFQVKCNGTWTAKFGSGDPVIEPTTTSGGNSAAGGEWFTFSTFNDENGDYAGGSAEILFTITCDNGETFTKTVTINFESGAVDADGGSNCYIIHPGGDGLMIPVSWANNSDSPNRISANEVLTAEVLWTDSSEGIGPNGNVSKFGIDGVGSSAKLVVYPGSASGNTIIAVKSGSTIKWSWHIWVTDYDPYNGTNGTVYNDAASTKEIWLDRNVGATSANPGNVNNMGMLYQFGRKDPFPPLAGWNTQSPIKIYKSKNTETSITTAAVMVNDNLENSIANPNVYYKGGQNHDWLTSGSSNHRSDLWNFNGKKSPYDPCPYGWKVPFASGKTAPPWTAINVSSSMWQSANRGINLTPIGFWPAAGRINSSGDYEAVASTGKGYYWSGHPNSSEGQDLNFSSSNIAHWSSEKRAFGQSVRCIKE